MIYSMAKVKLTPKDRKSMVARVNSGEKQADVARDYDISQGYLSKIVKQSASGKSKSDVSVSKALDLSDKTEEQLRNWYIQIHLDLLQYNGEIQQRLVEAGSLQESIEMESQKENDIRDESWILAQKRRLTWVKDTKQIGYQMGRLYQEASAILIEFAKRDVPVPYSVAVTKGLTPASRAT